MSMDTNTHCHHCEHEKTPFFKNKVFLITVVLGLIILSSYWVSLLVPFRDALLMYTGKIWWAIVLGLVIGGVIEHLVPHQYITVLLAQRKKRSILHAVLLGFLMSVCNHGILALSMQLYKKGASSSAVVAFLLASPWANLPLTILLVGFFGLIKGLYIILIAIVIAITTGLIFQWLETKHWVEQNPHVMEIDENFSISQDIRRRWSHYQFSWTQTQKDMHAIWNGMLSLSDMVLWWIILGMALASLAGAYIPENIFEDYMGPNFLGMLVTLGVATVIEVCSEGTAPLAFEVFQKTGALGNSFVFLMAGVVTDYTEIGLLWQNVGYRTALWLPMITVPQVLFWGYLANIIF